MSENVVVSNRRLGKNPVKHDDRNLKAAQYMRAVSTPPKAVDWISKVPQWNMFSNDRYGDCTCATAGHLIQKWTSYAAGSEVTLNDSDILKVYSAVTGFDPETGANDDGAYELDILNYWRKTGFAGRKIAAFVQLDPSNHNQIKQAINLFGGVYIGLALPVSAQNQNIWDAAGGNDGAPGSWGGHAVHAGAYDEDTVTVITWGYPQKMTWAFWDKYCDEAYAVLSPDWFFNGLDPQGFDLDTLSKDLERVRDDQPNVDPVDPVGPTPTPSALNLAITDNVVADKVVHAAARTKVTPDEWLYNHLKHYFKIR